MFNAARSLVRPARLAGLVAVAGGLAALTLGPIAGAGAAATPRTFSLFANPGTLGCLNVAGQPAPTATATVTKGTNNDTLTMNLSHFKPGLAFDMFTVQRSNQHADGSPDPTGFGMAWYQSDLHVKTNGSGSATIHTILLNQIFGFDADAGVALAPTNTFNVGFWFNNPADAGGCGFTGFTPFNGEHHAGPVAFITRPDAVTGLGPLCAKPLATTPPSCHP